MRQRIASQPPRHPSSLRPGLDRDLETIILKALEKDQVRRYQSAGELGDDLQRFLDGEAILARPPSAAYRLQKRLIKHRRVALALAGLVVLALLGAAGIIWWREKQAAAQLADARREALCIQWELEAGKAEEALCAAESLLGRCRELPEAPLVLAQARFQMGLRTGNQDRTNAALNAVRATPTRSAYRWAYRALEEEICRKKAVPVEMSFLEADERPAPDTAEAWYVYSFATLDPARARSYAERALACDGAFLPALGRLAYLYLFAGEYDLAIAAAEKIIDKGGSHWYWICFQGAVLLKVGDYRRAVDHYSAAIEHLHGTVWSGGIAEMYRQRAMAQLCLKEYSRAIDDLGKASSVITPPAPWELYRLATPLWISGRHAEAAEAYRALRHAQGYGTFAEPRLYLVLLDEARELERTGKTAEADRLSAEAAGVLRMARPDGTSAFLVRVLQCLGGQIDPRDLVDETDQQDPVQECESYYYAGEACLLRGLPGEACEWFRKCVGTGLVLQNVYPPDPMNEWHLARWRLDQLCGDAVPTTAPTGND